MKITTSVNLIITSILVVIVGLVFISIAAGSAYVIIFEKETIISFVFLSVFSTLAFIFLISGSYAIRDYFGDERPVLIDYEIIFDNRIMYSPIPFGHIASMNAIHSRFGVIGIEITTAIEIQTKQTAFRLACWSLLYVDARKRVIVSLIGLKPSASEIVSFIDEISRSRGIPFDKTSKLEKQLMKLSSSRR